MGTLGLGGQYGGDIPGFDDIFLVGEGSFLVCFIYPRLVTKMIVA